MAAEGRFPLAALNASIAGGPRPRPIEAMHGDAALKFLWPASPERPHNITRTKKKEGTMHRNPRSLAAPFLISILSMALLYGCGKQEEPQRPAKSEPASQAAPQPAAAGPVGNAQAGEAIYKKACFACHGTGVAGAPAAGDKEAWVPRIAQGNALLLQHAKNGLRAMPPKGGCGSCSDQDLADAIAYMVNQSR